MDIRQLEYFVRVAENRSFSRAAMVLDIAQSALSRQVRALEVELRLSLLTRTGRGVELTEAGERLHAHAVTLLQQLESARNDMQSSRGEPVGHVSIGFPPSIAGHITVSLVERFKRELPRARLSVVEGLSSHMSEWLVAGRIDLAVLYNPDPSLDLEFTPVFSESLCLVSPPGDNSATAIPRTAALSDLAALPLILPERSHMVRRLLERQATLSGWTLHVAWEVSSVQAIIDLVCAGHGHAVLPRSSIRQVRRARGPRIRPLMDPGTDVVVSLARPLNRRASVLSHKAAEMVTDMLTEMSA